MEIDAPDPDPGVGVVRGPFRPRRQGRRRRGEARLDRGDQLALPPQPLDLPDAQGCEADGQRQAQGQKGYPAWSGAAAAARGGAGWGAVGIMLPCR